MVGYRKFFIAILFLLVSLLLGWRAMDKGSALLDMAAYVGAVGVNLAAFYWNNAKEKACGKSEE